ncbi:hypothetical protein EB821_04690 [Candidatus Marinimicrobia bacterium PRS2]|nr:hypothetical protein EB821_04690 [Candidatus Marinimicrobia bacterium PRS2]
MKPTQSIYILLSLFLTFSCDDDTQTNEDTDDMMSLDWILLMKGVYTFNTYVESCDGYVEYEDGYDEYVGYECRCNVNWGDECGECILITPIKIRVNSCSGYELCEYVEEGFNFYNIQSNYDCCYEMDYHIVKYDDDGNTIDEFDDGNWIGETEIRYYYKEYLFNEYLLYWNDDVDVCEYNCDEEDIDNYDIVIPSHLPNYETNDCDGGGCESETYFHPNCDTPIDTTMMIENKSLSFEKMGWFDRDSYDNQFGYIHYYPLDNYLIFEGDDDLDISNYKIVDYQRKE